MRKIPRFGSLAAMLMVAVLLVAAISTPVLAFEHPCPCYGSVTLDGDPASVGTVIEIYIGTDDTPSQTFVVETAGEYLTDVWADEDRHGDELSYTVGGFPALQQGVFGWDGQEIDLTASTGPQPPQVTTNDANPIGHNSATLNGYVDIGEYSPVIVYFEYDGLKTPEMSKVASGAFSYPVSGLSPLTTYNFKAVAEYDTSTDVGMPKSFTTTEGPAWPVTMNLVDGWNVISTPVWLDEDSDRTDEILSGGVVNAYRWSGTRFVNLASSYKWEPLEAFYIEVSGTAAAEFTPMADMEAPNKRTLSSKKWALIGPSPIDGTGTMTVDEVLAGLNGNYVNMIIPATNDYCTSMSECTLGLPAFGGAWVFVGSASTRTIVGLYGFSPVESD